MAKGSWSRREFLGTTARCGVFLAGGAAFTTQGWLTCRADPRLDALVRQAPEARYWVSTDTAAGIADCLACHDRTEISEAAEHAHEVSTVRCALCARNCMIAPGDRGMCRARLNDGGKLRSLVYGRPISVHVDPIEKKPFYHFLPGAAAFSLATSGCPLRCKFCQNWEISQALPEEYETPHVAPKSVVAAAKQRSAPVIAFTYNEATVFTEYLTDIARLARPAGKRSVLVSCGFMNEAPLNEMCDVLDAIKIDLKGFSPTFYEKVCGASLAPVLRSIKQVARRGVHLEIVNLVVPTLNDSTEMLTELVKWMAGEIGPNVPIHFTRFHPDYQLPNLPPTPVATLERARAIALGHGIHYPYVGNVPGHPGNHTYCPECGEVVIRRRGFFVVDVQLEAGHCKFCKTKIHGVWS